MSNNECLINAFYQRASAQVCIWRTNRLFRNKNWRQGCVLSLHLCNRLDIAYQHAKSTKIPITNDNIGLECIEDAVLFAGNYAEMQIMLNNV